MKVILWVHVAIGFAGLLAFWFPVFSRKGGPLHRRAGRVYVVCAYVVLASAGASVLWQLSRFVGPERSIAEYPNTFSFAIFLGYLTVVTFMSVFHGEGVLRHKGQPQALKTPVRGAIAVFGMAASVIMVAYALLAKPGNAIVLLALSPIGVLGGWGYFQYVNNAAASPREWLYEHLGAMLGGGIAFHTAFMVLGANRLLDLGLSGWQQALPWVLPSIIGIPASIIWGRHYRLKYADT